MMRNVKPTSHKKSTSQISTSQHSTSRYRQRSTKRPHLPRPSIINLSPKRLHLTSKDSSFSLKPLRLSFTVVNTPLLHHSRFSSTLVNHHHTMPLLKPPIFVHHHLSFSTLSTPTPFPQPTSPQQESYQPLQQESHQLLQQEQSQPPTNSLNLPEPKIIPIEQVLKEDVVAASIPKPRNSTDQNQYKLGGSSQWKKPTELYQNLSHEERQEMKERFALENHHRMHSAMSRLRSTRGTIAYGSTQASDSMDGSMPQRNGSQSGNVLDAFDRAEKYRQKMAQKKQQSDILDRQQQLKEEQRKEFEFEPRKALELDMGEFSKNSDHLFKRESSQDELARSRLEQLLGNNWTSRWF